MSRINYIYGTNLSIGRQFSIDVFFNHSFKVNDYVLFTVYIKQIIYNLHKEQYSSIIAKM